MAHGRSLMVFNVDSMIGEAIVRELMDREHRSNMSQQFNRVYGTVCDLAHSGDLAALGVCLVEIGDSPDEKMLTDCLKQCKINTCILSPDVGSDHMVHQAKKIIKCSKNAMIERFALMSSIGVDDTSVETARQFNEIESTLKQSGMSTTAIVRIAPLQQQFFFYGKMLSQQNKLMWPVKNDVKFTTICLRDVAKFLVYELLQGGNISTPNAEPHMFKLTGTVIHSPKDICQILSQVLGRNIEYQQVDRPKFEEYLRKELLMPKQIVTMLADGMELVGRGRMNFVSDDHKKSTGKDPLKLEEWLKLHRDLFREEQGQSARRHKS